MSADLANPALPPALVRSAIELDRRVGAQVSVLCPLSKLRGAGRCFHHSRARPNISTGIGPPGV